jgi:dienelactone hydrolase
VKYSFTNYEGAKHPLPNKDADALGKKFSLPLQYNQAADQHSWEALSQALKRVYGK